MLGLQPPFPSWDEGSRDMSEGLVEPNQTVLLWPELCTVKVKLRVLGKGTDKNILGL